VFFLRPSRKFPVFREIRPHAFLARPIQFIQQITQTLCVLQSEFLTAAIVNHK
jgi:hypothetical protein